MAEMKPAAGQVTGVSIVINEGPLLLMALLARKPADIAPRQRLDQRKT